MSVHQEEYPNQSNNDQLDVIYTKQTLVENAQEYKRKCKLCKIEKPETPEFFQLTYLKNPKYKFKKHCKECQYGKWVNRLNKIKNDPILLAIRREKKAEYYRKYGKTDQVIQRKKEWFQKNKEKINENTRKNYHIKKKNPRYRIKNSISCRIRKLIHDKNYSHVFDILEYSVKELMDHLEKQFRDGMTWENYGKYWHIDHIKPVSYFKFNSKLDPEFKECWKLTNLQPLLVFENLSKGNRYIG